MDEATIQKADQIAHRFFTKFALVVDNARIPDERREINRMDKWFNLETPDIEVYKEPLRIYKSISLQPNPPPLELQLLLVIPELTRGDQVLVYSPSNSSKVQIEPTPTHILLETWLCRFLPRDDSERPSSSGQAVASETAESSDVTLPSVYKHSISVFRSLYTLLRVLPSWKLCKRLRKKLGGNSSLSIDLRVRFGDVEEDPNLRIMGFDTPLPSLHRPLPSFNHVFPPVSHPFGSLSISVQYLTDPNFAMEARESLISSRLLDQAWDGANAFTPTIASARSRDRDGLSGIGSGLGALPARMPLARSPPRAIPGSSGTGLGVGTGAGQSAMSDREATTSIADRFVLPLGNASRTSLSSAPNTSPLARLTPLPGTSTTALPLPTPGQRASPFRTGMADPTVGSAGSAASSTRLSAEGYKGVVDSSTVSSVSPRTRKESTGRGSSVDLPSAPVAFPQRRPSLNTIHPFKSGPLIPTSSPHSPASSLRHGSPLPTIPARMQTTYDTRTLTGAGPSQPFPISAGQMMRSPSSPVAPMRPSPPFAPSSLEREKRFSVSSGIGLTGALPSSGESADQAGGVGAPRRKRYSSSFGHRYTAAAGLAGSEGSAGSGEKDPGALSGGVGLGRERRESERGATASYLSANADDDDLSAFVQDIDARSPLGGSSSPVSTQRSRQVLSGLGIERIGSSRERTLSEARGEPPGPSRTGPSARPTGDNEREPVTDTEALPRLTSELRRRSNPLVASPEMMRERTVSEGGRNLGQLVIPGRMGVGRSSETMTLDERLKRLNDDFAASLKNLEGRSSSDKGKGKERMEEATSSRSGNGSTSRRVDLPSSPSLSSSPRLTSLSTHARTSSLSERPSDRTPLTLQHARYSTEIASSPTSLAPPPLSRRSATTPIGPIERLRDLGTSNSSESGSALVSTSNSVDASGVGVGSNAGLDVGRTRAPSRLSSESGAASGRGSGASSEFVGGRMELGQ